MINTFFNRALYIWLEFGLKPRYFALHLTDKYFITLPPPARDRINSVDCTLGLNIQWEGDLVSEMFKKKLSVFRV